ncbi:sugar phosphate nucleotidyltransferase [Chloroflexota bacterium]
MQLVILSGGLATRLRPLTETIPKSLVEIVGRPFLEYQIGFLKTGGIRDIVLCVGYLGEKIEEYVGNGGRFGVDIKYSYEREKLLGMAGALKNAEDLLEDRFFVMNGDSYLFLDFDTVMSYFEEKSKPGLMVVYKNYDRYDRSNVVVEGNLVKQYNRQEKTEDMFYIDYGASILEKSTLSLVPPDQVYSMDELYQQLIPRQELLAYEVKKRFYEIGSPEGLAEFREVVARGEILL